MIRKLLFLLGYLLITVVGLIGTVHNILLLAGSPWVSPSERPLWQIVVFLVVFAVAALLGGGMVACGIRRMIIDDKIKKENK